jgi:hypothetical protein
MTRRILSIDGGGILGLIPAMILSDIEARAGRPATELFDLVAGTSTGGIIACAVAAGSAADRSSPGLSGIASPRGSACGGRSTGPPALMLPWPPSSGTAGCRDAG